MAGNGEQLARLLRLITMIQGDRHWGPALIANHLAQSERTVYRDLNRLKQGGVPIEYDPAAGGYRIRRGFFLPPLDLSAEEACALLMLSDRVVGAEQLPMARPTATALEKLRGGLPEALRTYVGRCLPHVRIHLSAGEGAGNEDVWGVVATAIAERRSLSCVYEAANAACSADGGDCTQDGDDMDREPEGFRFDPYQLYWGQRAWYAIGLHHGRGEPRTLRLARFTRIQPTDDTFDIPDGFCPEAYLGQAWRMIPGDRVRRQVVLRFSASVAETVAETAWHRTQQIEYHADGSVTARFEIDGLDEVGWWVLGYGPQCEVIEPKELRTWVADQLKAAARRYEGGDGNSGW